MRHPRDLSGHLPLSRLNSFVMEPISIEAFKPAFPDDRAGSAISWTVGRAAAERGATFTFFATARWPNLRLGITLLNQMERTDQPPCNDPVLLSIITLSAITCVTQR